MNETYKQELLQMHTQQL